MMTPLPDAAHKVALRCARISPVRDMVAGLQVLYKKDVRPVALVRGRRDGRAGLVGQ